MPAPSRHKYNFLRSNGIPAFEAVQEEGEFMLTFPYGYHCGFNEDRNMAAPPLPAKQVSHTIIFRTKRQAPRNSSRVRWLQQNVEWRH